MKILHLIDSGGLYGAEKMLIELAREQIKLGLMPAILSAGEPGIKEKPLETEAKKQGIPVKAWRMSPGLNLVETKKIIEWAKMEGFTHFHSHGYKFNVHLSILSFIGYKLHVITTIHGYTGARLFTKQWLYELLDRLLVNQLDYIVLVNESMLTIPSLKKLPEHKIRIIHNGIRTDYDVNNLPENIENFIGKFPRKLVAIGRLAPEKGFDRLLEAMSLLNAEAKHELALVIVGEGRLHKTLTDRIRDLGLENVMLPGYCDNIGEILDSFDAVVIPSLTEGLPITLLEAMRAGKYIIASSVGGIPDAITSDCGVLVPPADIDKLKSSLEDFINSDVHKYENKVKARFRSLFSAESMAKRYMDCYTN